MLASGDRVGATKVWALTDGDGECIATLKPEQGADEYTRNVALRRGLMGPFIASGQVDRLALHTGMPRMAVHVWRPLHSIEQA